MKVVHPRNNGYSLLFDEHGMSEAEAATLQAVAYADVFDYPLTAEEVHRYLVGVQASPGELLRLLHNGRLMPRYLTCHDDYITLAGREEIVKIRRRRAAIAARMWPRAALYGAIIASMPFVRMVCVTGALAVDNVERDTDIDYLIVTEPGRLWMCRLLVITLNRLACLFRDQLCPNYFLSERALALQEHSLFTAHELVQMVPISGTVIYDRMCRLNDWVYEFLPNAYEQLPPRTEVLSQIRRFTGLAAVSNARYSPRTLAETLLRSRSAGWLEQWEMNRKVRKFTARSKPTESQEVNLVGNDRPESEFCADLCKGHFGGHGQRTLEIFANRLQMLAIPKLSEAVGQLETDMTGGST